MDTNNASQNPIRSVDWRDRMARQQVDSGRLILFHDGDLLVKEITKYLRLKKLNPSDAVKKRLAERMPYMDGAFQIHDARGGSIRDLLEAYLLTGQSALTISERLRIAPEVVSTYAAAFFDVADRLDQANFILQEVIFSGKGNRTSAGYLKLIGYLEGMSALGDFVDRTEIAGANKLLNRIEEETRFLLVQKILYVLRELDVHDHQTAAELLKNYTCRAVDGKQADQQSDRLMEHVMAMMKSIPLCVRGRNTENIPPELRKYQLSAVELTYDELMQVSMGQTLENEAELLALKIPPRPTTEEQSANREPPEIPPSAHPPQVPPVEAPHQEISTSQDTNRSERTLKRRRRGA